MEVLLTNPLFLATIIALAIIELVLKGFALWKAGRNNELAWFICILVINTAGILPAIYLLFFSKKASSKSKK